MKCKWAGSGGPLLGERLGIGQSVMSNCILHHLHYTCKNNNNKMCYSLLLVLLLFFYLYFLSFETVYISTNKLLSGGCELTALYCFGAWQVKAQHVWQQQPNSTNHTCKSHLSCVQRRALGDDFSLLQTPHPSRDPAVFRSCQPWGLGAVSYTHLTLPTILLV